MLERIINQFFLDAPIELIYLLLGTFIMYFINIFHRRAREYVKRKSIRKELLRLKSEQANPDNRVVDIANGDPSFANDNIFIRTIDLFGKTKSLYIAVPQEYKNKIKLAEKKIGYNIHQKTKFFGDTSFDNSSSFVDLQEITGIRDLCSLIEKHRKIVAADFLNNKNGMLFNGKKFGVFNLQNKRFGEDENPGVYIELFETDYFTHKVFRSIYHELKINKHEITKINSHNFLKYKPFLTSFGVNTLLITEGDYGDEITLSKRRNEESLDRSLYHITMNEGLSQTDIDPFGKIDLELCFKRGLLEELGITENIYKNATHASFYDFFIDMKNFELGLTSVIKFPLSFEKDIALLIARDKTLETTGFVSIPLNSNKIIKFLSDKEMIPHGKYTLQRVLLRENIKNL